MRKNRPGYPLPSGELGNDEIVCQLVYLPDRPEYWQALLGAISYMGTWVAWEPDDDKRGKDAAANWREAFELTIGCWRMTCLEEIKALLVQLIAAQCCDSNIFTQQPSGIAPNTGTEIEYEVGDPPDFYGDVAITTWEEWADYKCQAAHLLVEEVAIKFEQLGGLQTDYGGEDVTVEMIGWVVSKLTPLLIFINLAWDIFQAITGIGWELLGDFSTAAAQIRAAADDIACAITLGDGAKDTAADFEAACKVAVTTVAGDLLLGAMPWEAWANIIYTGIAIDNEGNELYLSDVLTPGEYECCGPTKIIIYAGHDPSGHHEYTLHSDTVVSSPNFERAGATFKVFDESANKLVSLLSIDTNHAINNDRSGGTYELYNLGGIFYNSDTPPTLPVDVSSFVFYDARASGGAAAPEFEMTITWEET